MGIEVARSKHGIFLCPRNYILDSVYETRLLGCKPIDNQIEQNHMLSQCSNSSSINRGKYQRLVGKLIYLSHTYPNMTYVVYVVNQLMHDPHKPHINVVERILRYLNPRKGILFSNHRGRKVY